MSINGVIKAGSLTRQSLSGVWLKKVFWRWRIYCVLKTDNRLELHSNKRSFGNGRAPKVIDLSVAICICPAEYIRPGAFLILTESVHICLSSASVVDRDEWIAALNGSAKLAINMATDSNSQTELQTSVGPDGALVRQPTHGASLYIRIWPVNVLPSTVTTPFQLHGRYWFAANNSEICVLPYASPAGPLLNVSFSTIRCCGGVGQTRVFFELGRQANTGEGTLWLQAISTSAADDMKRFLSEFLSKRDPLADGSKKSKKSDRLLVNAGRVKHGSNAPSNENTTTTGDEIIDSAVTSTPLPHRDTQFPEKVLPKETSYLEIVPPKHSSTQVKKPLLPSLENTSNETTSVAAQCDRDNTGADAVQSPQLQRNLSENISTVNPKSPLIEPCQKSVSATTPSSESATTPPGNAKGKQQTQLQIEKVLGGGGDYVVVCAPKNKAVLHSKSQDSTSSTTAASASNEDLAPFLADEFQAGAPLTSAVGDFKLDCIAGPVNICRMPSGGASSVSPSSGPVQYVSLQINADEAVNKAMKETDKSQQNTLTTADLQAPQMSSVSVIYADLDFTPAPEN